jgi:hypothetical protein
MCACCSFKQCHVSFNLLHISEDDHNSYISKDNFVFPFDPTFLRYQVPPLPGTWPHAAGCPSKHTYVATAYGGYISTSNVKDDDIAAANITGDDNDHEMSE